MQFKGIFDENCCLERLFSKISPIWLPVLVYFAVIEVLVLFVNPALFLNLTMALTRLLFLSIFAGSLLWPSHRSKKNKNTIEILLVYASLTLLYKETAVLNQFFYPLHDPLLEQWDAALFGFQPALMFSETFPSAVISELLFMGYFSYYLMPLVVLGYLYRKAPEKLMEFGFMLIGSFLVYYFNFILFPAVGPQFYWEAPDNAIETKGVFGKLIKIIQTNGEAPTAAFPSSHVGISIIVLFWLFKNNIRLYLFLMPFTVLLVLATVYIKAHYAVDVIGGIVSAFLVYFLMNKWYFSLPTEEKTSVVP